MLKSDHLRAYFVVVLNSRNDEEAKEAALNISKKYGVKTAGAEVNCANFDDVRRCVVYAWAWKVCVAQPLPMLLPFPKVEKVWSTRSQEIAHTHFMLGRAPRPSLS